MRRLTRARQDARLERMGGQELASHTARARPARTARWPDCRYRWVVERTISWLLRFKRLGLRYDRTERTLAPLLTLGMVLINLRRLVEHEF
jgi:Transposase DDE domain